MENENIKNVVSSEKKENDFLKTDKDIIKELKQQTLDYSNKLNKAIEENKKLYDLLMNGGLVDLKKDSKIDSSDIDKDDDEIQKKQQKELCDKIFKDIKEKTRNG